MQLVLIGSAGSSACDWRDYALLRDNIQHFIERGAPSLRFAELHRIETAVDTGSCIVDAARLRGEALRACYALSRITVDQAAVSMRTRAILTGSVKEPTTRGTGAARRLGWCLPLAAASTTRISEAAERFVFAVLQLTEQAVDGDTLEIRRSGEAPRFVRANESDAPTSARLLERASFSAGALSIALMLAGCSASVSPPPRAPSDLTSSDPPSAEQQQQFDQPDLVAPPPAYGNKVVLARR